MTILRRRQGLLGLSQPTGVGTQSRRGRARLGAELGSVVSRPTKDMAGVKDKFS